MSVADLHLPQSSIPSTADSLSERTARVIQDPFRSVIAGVAATAASFGLVISAMYGLSLVS